MAVQRLDQLSIKQQSILNAQALPSGSLASFAAQQQLRAAMQTARNNTAADTFGQAPQARSHNNPIHLANTVGAHSATFGMNFKRLLFPLLILLSTGALNSCQKEDRLQLPPDIVVEPGVDGAIFEKFFDIDNAKITNTYMNDGEGRFSSAQSEIVIPSLMPAVEGSAPALDLDGDNGMGKATVLVYNFNTQEEVELPVKEFKDISVLPNGDLRIVTPFAVSRGSKIDLGNVSFTLNGDQIKGGNITLRGEGDAPSDPVSPKGVTLRYGWMTGSANGDGAVKNYSDGLYSGGSSWANANTASNDNSQGTVVGGSISRSQAEANAKTFVNAFYQADGSSKVDEMPWDENPVYKQILLGTDGSFSPHIAAGLAALSSPNSPFNVNGLTPLSFLLPENNPTGRHIFVEYSSTAGDGGRVSIENRSIPGTNTVVPHAVVKLSPNLMYEWPASAQLVLIHELGHIATPEEVAGGSLKGENSIAEELANHWMKAVIGYPYVTGVASNMGFDLPGSGNRTPMWNNSFGIIYLHSGEQRSDGIPGVKPSLPKDKDGFGAGSISSTGVSHNSVWARMSLSYGGGPGSVDNLDEYGSGMNPFSRGVLGQWSPSLNGIGIHSENFVNLLDKASTPAHAERMAEVTKVGVTDLFSQ